ncbi:MAG: OmpA family protein [Chitinophagaceae bacterium]|jgi:outer membrane protein OmpA-like peptidoglycan-associated protein|nr:OmpA family protein [Chitinophagaceae bacterium]MBK7680702.1 OmpA family protein [Chitinophagaceae bacterium]MBK9465002.1 OmpA family protein [Chitinophagaceae bacterium]MBK9660265.1 OmpA family protein [Chitinophagaceae bacterium]MBK9939702.1 OmpA family protein [Chitinophagaceae bacterium]
MASKKYLLLAGIFCLLASTGFSQRVGASYDVKDSSLVPSKRMPQHSEFLNGTYNFPAKPRNQWEIGIKGGLFQVSGDIPAKFVSPGFGLHVRKAFGYIFSMRLEYLYGIGKGQHFRATENYAKNPAWGVAIVNPAQRYSAPQQITGAGGFRQIVSSQTGLATTPFEYVFYNYKTKVQDLSLEGVLTLNNVRFHKSKTGYNVYGFAGIGASIYDTKVNALDGANKYNFTSIAQSAYTDRKDKLKELKNFMDDTYETPAENHGDRRPKLFGDTFKPSATIGMGIAFKLSNRLNLALEDRWTFIKDDLLDGQRWQEAAWGDAVQTRDFDSYNYLSLGLNINLGAKSVEPLWWLNPLDYAYSEIRNPRLMRLPKPVLPDSDGDGVTDQFDQEQTPAGCPVDSHGVTKDTDGDGIPDCKDKELITPTYCQPVDADGIGKCPCPDGCAGIAPPEKTCAELMGSLPSVAFKASSNKLDDDAKSALATVAARLRNNPGCKVVVIGYCNSTKKEQQLSWDHVNAVINYMVDKEGISADRFFFNYGKEGGDCNTVDLRPAAEGETGDNTVDPPHPNLRKN